MNNPNHEDAGGFGELQPPVRIPAGPIIGLIKGAIEEHRQLCPLATDQIPERLRTLETRTATLVGLIVGSSILGGSLTAALAKLL